MSEDNAPSAGVIPVDGTVRPVAWVIDYAGNEKELYFDRKPYGLSQSPLYDQAALDAAVAAERKRCAKLCEDTLRAQAADAESMAAQKRQQATILDGEAAGLLRAADMLRDIERPQ